MAIEGVLNFTSSFLSLLFRSTSDNPKLKYKSHLPKPQYRSHDFFWVCHGDIMRTIDESPFQPLLTNHFRRILFQFIRIHNRVFRRRYNQYRVFPQPKPLPSLVLIGIWCMSTGWHERGEESLVCFDLPSLCFNDRYTRILSRYRCYLFTTAVHIHQLVVPLNSPNKNKARNQLTESPLQAPPPSPPGTSAFAISSSQISRQSTPAAYWSPPTISSGSSSSPHGWVPWA